MLEAMEPIEISKLAKEAEEKLSQGIELTQTEILALLAKLVVSQETRKERKYGQG